MEIPSEFTIARAHWVTAKIARADTPATTTAEMEPSSKSRKVTFSDEVMVHQYEVKSNCSSDSDSILCPESPENSDSLFNTDTESESETESVEFVGGKRAKKSLKVKFSQMP